MDYKALLSDDKTFSSFKNGDEAAFSNIYEAFNEVIYITTINIVGTAQDAEDITAHTFMRAWERRASIQSMLHLKNLLFTIARNLSINALKDRSKKSYGLTDDVFNQLDESIHTDYHTDQIFADLVEQIHQVINRMPVLRRRIFQMRFMEEQSAEAVAGLLKISASSVYYHTQEAMLILQSALCGNKTAANVLALLLLFALPEISISLL